MDNVYVPITDSLGFRGFGHWDRRRGVCPPLDFWGRHGLDLRRLSCSPGTQSIIPHDVQLGFGNMHLDDWLSPDELIGAILEDEMKMCQRQMLRNGQGKKIEAPAAIVEGKDVFEVKLNVSDYKPEELKVKIFEGLVTIEGQHEEDTDTKPKQEKAKDDKVKIESHGHISKRFKRTFTLPRNVLDDQLECKLTEDGHLLLCAPVKSIAPAPDQHANARVPITPLKDTAEKKLEAAALETDKGKDETPKDPAPSAPASAAGEDQVDKSLHQNWEHQHDRHHRTSLNDWFLTLLSVIF